jgi:hypothetical protein
MLDSPSFFLYLSLSMEQVHRLQGRDVREEDLAQIRSLVAAHPDWSRNRLSIELAQDWGWRAPAGQLKDMAARSLLLKLEQRGWITLPPRRRQAPKRLPAAPELALKDGAPPLITAQLSALTPIALETVPANHPAFRRYLAQYHYLGYRGPVGENIAYLARDRCGRDLACALFGAAAWKTKPRDAWIGWDDDTRAHRLSLVVNNHRFLILPWVQVPHLASHILGRIARRLSEDWQAKYGHPIHLLETFVERERFKGTCYRAANFKCVGQTQGRSRQDRMRTIRVPVKDIYLYPLTPRFRELLSKTG